MHNALCVIMPDCRSFIAADPAPHSRKRLMLRN